MFQIPIQDFLSYAWKPNVHPQRYIFVLVTDMVDKSVYYLRFFVPIFLWVSFDNGFAFSAHFALQWM